MSLTESEQVRAKFFADVQQQLGYAPETVRAILGKLFNGFSTRKLSDYWMILREMRAKEIEAEERALDQQALERNAPVPYPPCPRCGAPTVGDLSSYGRYTKTPGFRCTKGGLRHFLEWKANQILRNQGRAPIYAEYTGETGDGIDYDLVWRVVAQMEDVETRHAYAAVLACLKPTATVPANPELVARVRKLMETLCP